MIDVSSAPAARVLLDHESEAVFVADPDGRLISVNPAASQLTGYSTDELLNRSLPEVVPLEDLSVPRLAEMLAAGSLVTERRLRRRGGALVEVEIRWNLRPDGLVVGAARDITERKRLQREQGGERSASGAGRVSGEGRLRSLDALRPLGRELLFAICRWSDTAVALAVLAGTDMLANLDSMPDGLSSFLAVRISIRNILALAIFAALWRSLCGFAGLYDWRVIRRRRKEVVRVAIVAGVGAVVVAGVPLLGKTFIFHPTLAIPFWLASGFGMMMVRLAVRNACLTCAGAFRDIIIVGSGPRAAKLYRDMQANPIWGYKVIGCVDTVRSAEPGHADELGGLLLGSLDDLERLLVQRPIDEVMITLPVRSFYSDVQGIIDVCERVGVRACLMDVFRASRSTRLNGDEGPAPTMTVKVASEDGRLIIKWAVDVGGAFIGLLLLSPLLLVVAVAVALTSPGPVLFAQERYGFQKRRFRMYKFRTMVADAEVRQHELETMNEAKGPVFKIEDDPRLTPLGRLLRKTSIDELPQLINVLHGEMSLVGPRPLPCRDVSRFTEAALMRRFSVRPGLTCLWQISGRSNLTFAEWIALDLKYIDEWSLALDFSILARTLPAILSGRGAR